MNIFEKHDEDFKNEQLLIHDESSLKYNEHLLIWMNIFFNNDKDLKKTMITLINEFFLMHDEPFLQT